MEFTTLKQLPQAKKYLTENGMTVTKDNTTLRGGRQVFYVRNTIQQWHLNDYELLAFASNDAWQDEEN